MSPQRPFAVFDIDGTLIRWQLFHAIVHHLGQQGYILRRHHDTIRSARLAWKNRETSQGFKDYEKVLVDVYLDVLKQIEPDVHAQIIDDVVAEYQDQTHVYTRDLVRKLKEQGYLLFAVSGSHQVAVERVARHHGFDAVIGAKFEIIDGQYTGVCTTPIFDKKTAVQTLVKQFDATYAGSYAVGDSSSDASMLELVENPVAFNPDQTFFEIARQKSWPIVVERKNVVYELNPNPKGYQLNL